MKPEPSHHLPTESDRRRDVLVDVDWLASHLSDPDVRVVEVDVSRAAFDEWHIDGAVLWNIYSDLKDGDYRLVERPALEQLFVRSGITPETTVVFYGYAPAMGFWLMKLHGHSDVRILDCSRDTWRDEGHPWNRASGNGVAAGSLAGGYPLGGEDRTVRAARRDVEEAIGAPSATIVDVRSDLEYRGDRFWPSGAMEPNGRAGHIPTAVHQPIDGLYDPRGAFRSTGELRDVFFQVDLDSHSRLITYCTIGGRAATAWFVLSHLLGRSGVEVYDGSWAEWGRMADNPVEAA